MRYELHKMPHQEIFFNQEIETTSQDELISRQNEKLKEKVRYVFENNAYMRDLYTKAGVDVNDFRGIEDMDKLPAVSYTHLDVYKRQARTVWEVFRIEKG